MGKDFTLVEHRNIENPDTLLHVVRLMREEITKGTSLYLLETKYQALKNRYPSLYDLVTKNDCNMDILERMIFSMKRIQSGEKTSEEMDKEIGYVLAKEYVYSNIDMSKESSSN